jgi:selenocysteine-specific elongation factor
MIETVAPTGIGIVALRGAGFAAAARQEAAAGAWAAEPFRFAVDRVFSVAGCGTVVTGTDLRGRVRSGDTLLLSPKGRPARVRGVQLAGASAHAPWRNSRWKSPPRYCRALDPFAPTRALPSRPADIVLLPRE